MNMCVGSWLIYKSSSSTYQIFFPSNELRRWLRIDTDLKAAVYDRYQLTDFVLTWMDSGAQQKPRIV
jgi:hypothetical protein